MSLGVNAAATHKNESVIVEFLVSERKIKVGKQKRWKNREQNYIHVCITQQQWKRQKKVKKENP